jgi:hypothetical protein
MKEHLLMGNVSISQAGSGITTTIKKSGFSDVCDAAETFDIQASLTLSEKMHLLS